MLFLSFILCFLFKQKLACIILYRFLSHDILIVTTILLSKTIYMYIWRPRIYLLESNLLSLIPGLVYCMIGGTCTLGCVVCSLTASCPPQLKAPALFPYCFPYLVVPPPCLFPSWVIHTCFVCSLQEFVLQAKLKKMFVWHCLPRVSLLGRSVGIFFFFNIYNSHMDGNGKKKISDLEKKI